MSALSKVSLRTRQHDEARTIVGVLENLVHPGPEAVSCFEEGPDAWRIEAYFAELPNLADLTVRLTVATGRRLPPIEAESVPDLNWVAISQAALPPVTAGRFVVHGSHDRERIPPGPNAIEIDAGEAFGTAHHATTHGCLLAIDHWARAHGAHRVLDLGCGSGVLAIAAARALPRANILASDCDPKAVAVATRNARANGVGERITFVCARGLAHAWLRHGAPYDLVIANILAAPLRTLAPQITRAVRPGGTLVLSGLLIPEAASLVARYVALGFALLQHRRIAGWSTLTLRKRR